jgi:hypothetical protein
MSNKHIRWLYDQLPGLVQAGVLSADGAERLRGHYGNAPLRSGRTIALTIFSALGAALIGSGIILLLAHNWEGLARPVRCVLSLAPLVITQLLFLWTQMSRRDSAPWREGTAMAVCLCIGASIALVGQTYHIPGDLGQFLLVWSLLGLPMIYLARSTFACLLYWAAIIGWAGYEQAQAGQAALFWALMGASLPFVAREAKRDVESPQFAWLCWGLALCLLIATGIVLEGCVPGLWIIVYASLAGVFYLAGHALQQRRPSPAWSAFITAGRLGIPALAFIFTWEDVWEHIGWDHCRWTARFHPLAATLDYVLTGALLVAAVALLVAAWRRDRARIVYGIMPVLATVAYALACLVIAGVPMLLFNVYMFALGLFTISAGIRGGRLGTLNGGMLILTAVLVARFFDSDLGFVARGVAFILIGVGFLAANLVMVRKSKGGAQ